MPATIDRFKWPFSVIAFTADFLLCDITWYTQARSKIPNVAYLFSESDIKQYDVSLLVWVSYCFDTLHGKWWATVHSQLVFNLNTKKFGSPLYALSESISHSNGFLRHLSLSILCIILVCFPESLFVYRFNSRKKILWKQIISQRINWEIFMNISLKLFLFWKPKQHKLSNSMIYILVQSFSHADCQFSF